MTTCPEQPNVAAFLLGALTPSEERATMAHAATCPTCQVSLHELAIVPDALALVPRSVLELIDRSGSDHAATGQIRRRETHVRRREAHPRTAFSAPFRSGSDPP